MNYLSLFSGVGCGDLAMQWLINVRCIGYVEKDKYCQEVIRQRIIDSVLDSAPIFGDIRKFIKEDYASQYRGVVDIIIAGFPCQPFSNAGLRKREEDDRNMWLETIKAIEIIKPFAVLLENVPGIRPYLPVVIRDLRRAGFTVKKPQIISAADTGCLHQRERVWIFAHTDGYRWRSNGVCKETKRQLWPEFEGLVQEVLQSAIPSRSRSGIHDGASKRMDRLRAAGNGMVPRVVARAWDFFNG